MWQGVALATLAFCVFVMAMGAVGVVAPRSLIAFVRRFHSRGGLFAAAGLRLVFGAALFLAAPETRAPGALRVLGAFVFAAGLVTPLFGVDRFGRLLDWWTSRGEGFLRAWSACALAFGWVLAWAVLPSVATG